MRISPPETETARFFTYPGARAPDRQRTVDAGGIALAVYEWGDIAAPPLLLAHGAFDFACTFDVFAPLLAEQRSGLARPLPACTSERPDWLAAVMNMPALEKTEVADALREYASLVGQPA